MLNTSEISRDLVDIISKQELFLGNERDGFFKLQYKSGYAVLTVYQPNKNGRPVFNKRSKDDDKLLIEKVGKELRKMMPWM